MAIHIFKNNYSLTEMKPKKLIEYVKKRFLPAMDIHVPQSLSPQQSLISS